MKAKFETLNYFKQMPLFLPCQCPVTIFCIHFVTPLMNKHITTQISTLYNCDAQNIIPNPVESGPQVPTAASGFTLVKQEEEATVCAGSPRPDVWRWEKLHQV